MAAPNSNFNGFFYEINTGKFSQLNEIQNVLKPVIGTLNYSVKEEEVTVSYAIPVKYRRDHKTNRSELRRSALLNNKLESH